MKKVCLFAILLFLSVFSVKAQYFKNDTPCIKPFAVEIHNINDVLGDTCHPKLYEENGWVMIPNTFYIHDGNSKGILIVHDWADVYQAYEIKCTYCADKGRNGVFTNIHSIFAECNTCTARAEMMFNVGNGQLTGYPYERGHVWYLMPYPIEESERGDKLYLVMFPNPTNERKL